MLLSVRKAAGGTTENLGWLLTRHAPVQGRTCGRCDRRMASSRLDLQCEMQSTAVAAAGTLATSLPAVKAMFSMMVVLPAAGTQMVYIQMLVMRRTFLRWAHFIGTSQYV